MASFRVDSFLAILIQGLIHAQDIQNTLNKACAMGALVAGSSGANPEITEDALLSFMNGRLVATGLRLPL